MSRVKSQCSRITKYIGAEQIFIDNEAPKGGNGTEEVPISMVQLRNYIRNQKRRKYKVGINSVQETNSLDPYYPNTGELKEDQYI